MTTHMTNVTRYTVKTGDNLTVIAAMYGTSVDKIVKWNHIQNPDLIHPGQVLIVGENDSPHNTFYTVRSGDNLTKIAKKYETTVNQLVKWNGIEDPNVIRAGQRLIVAKSEPASV